MANLRLYYKSDYKIRETFKTQAGETIDPRNFNFKFVFIAGKENTFTCSHTIGAADEWVNCVYDSENNAVLCTLDNHNLLPGLLKRELTIEEPDSDFPDGKLDYITFKAYEIELVDTTDGDSLYDIYDEEIVITGGKVNPVELAEILHESETKDAIIDADEVNYLDSENNFSLVKTTWLNIKSKLKAYFDTIFEPKKAATDLYVTQAEKSTWNAKQDALSADVDYLTPTTASTTYEPKKGENDNYVTDYEKTVIENTSGENTGDETAESIINKIGTDGKIKSDYLPSLDYSTNIEADKLSTTKVSAIKTLYDWAVGKFIDLTKIVTTWTATTLDTNIPSEKLVKDSLNLKADITPANGSTSALRALFIARGYDARLNTYHCAYNENTGYYEMNGLTDITEAEMINIYIASIPLKTIQLVGSCANYKGRTLYPIYYFPQDYLLLTRFAAAATKLITVKSNENNITNALILSFAGCSNLETFETLNITYITSAGKILTPFLNCAKLTNIKLKGLKVDFTFASSPLLSLASLQYLVTNRANGTTRITITVHADVWAKLNDLGNPEWNALLVDAVANQYIDFASA